MKINPRFQNLRIDYLEAMADEMSETAEGWSAQLQRLLNGPINKVIIAKWVKALKGKYRRKGQRTVTIMFDHVNESYSALGVLCDILEPNGWEFGEGYMWHDKHLTYPSTEFLQRHGVSESLAMFVDTLNDECDKSLGQIADYLQRKYLQSGRSPRRKQGKKIARSHAYKTQIAW